MISLPWSQGPRRTLLAFGSGHLALKPPTATGDLGERGSDKHSLVDRPGAPTLRLGICGVDMDDPLPAQPGGSGSAGETPSSLLTQACAPRHHFRGLCFTQRGLIRRQRLGRQPPWELCVSVQG